MTAQTMIAAGASLLAAACATAQPPADSPPLHGGNPGQKCDPANIQQFVGQQATSQLGAQMLRVSGAAVIRWVPQGTAVTMEFRFDRLTIFLDANSRIERISCS